MLNGLFALLAILAILVLLFLVFRAVVLWYFKIDEAIQLLRNIDERLRLIPGEKKRPDA